MKTSELPSLNAIRAFEAASRHSNFRLAAEELGVSQGAVAQHVRGLEDSLGVTLFDRLPRTLALTEPGEEVREHPPARVRTDRGGNGKRAARAAAAADQRHALIRGEVAACRACPTSRAKHPGLDLGIVASERRTSFHSDNVDLAVRYGPPPAGPHVTVDLLFDDELIAVCSPALLADTQLPLPADALHNYVLLHDAHGQWPEFIETALQHSATGTSRGVRFNQTALAIDAALGGQGIALASRYFVESDLAAGRLINPFGITLQSD